MRKLIDILPPNLKAGLTLAERRVLEAAPKGEEADLQVGDEKIDDPANADKWADTRTIRAKFLYWLCTNEEATKLVHAKGVQIIGIKIAETLDFENAFIPRPLLLLDSYIPHGIILRQTHSQSIYFSGSHTGPISADELDNEGTLSLDRVHTKGEVRLPGASIGGQLSCKNAEFENPEGHAFCADRLSVKDSVFLDDVHAKGEVRLIGASIGGQLSCENAEFDNMEGDAFNADGLSVEQIVRLDYVHAKGEVCLLGASIGGQLSCNNAEFDNAEGNAFLAENLSVSGPLFWRGVKKINGRLNLANAKVGQLVDDEKSWPQNGNLFLYGFEYGSFAGENTPISAKQRLKWLRLQPNKPFWPQPYEQLAKVYRSMGHEADARKVLIAKQDDQYKHGDMGIWSRLSNRFWGLTLGHGYRIWPILSLFLIIPLLGWSIFWLADANDVMQPSKEGVYLHSSYKSSQNLPGEYPHLEPFFYSLDAFIPFVNLHQEDYWLADISRSRFETVSFPLRKYYVFIPKWSWGWWVRGYLWFHIIMGWVLTSLLVTYISGKVRKD